LSFGFATSGMSVSWAELCCHRGDLVPLRYHRPEGLPRDELHCGGGVHERLSVGRRVDHLERVPDFRRSGVKLQAQKIKNIIPGAAFEAIAELLQHSGFGALPQAFALLGDQPRNRSVGE
jgi:hypothetical protein